MNMFKMDSFSTCISKRLLHPSVAVVTKQRREGVGARERDGDFGHLYRMWAFDKLVLKDSCEGIQIKDLVQASTKPLHAIVILVAVLNHVTYTHDLAASGL